ncbi:MAG: hypothetical protein GC160_01310 [Acidobacteria bacterium]|nr:hypothetical protein [Acidobacteriota bacterium]
MRGEWTSAGGILSVTQDDALYKKYKNHGPIVFYDLPLGDSKISFEVKLADAKRFVFTLNGAKGHVFRLLQQADGGVALAFADVDGKHVSKRMDESVPAVVNGEWVRYQIENRGEQVSIHVGDAFRKTVRDASYGKEKTNLSLSFHFGTMQVRNLSVEP